MSESANCEQQITDEEVEMQTRQILVGLLVLATVGLLAGCGQAATEAVSPDAVPVVSAGDENVVA
jgi:hypothetical protein